MADSANIVTNVTDGATIGSTTIDAAAIHTVMTESTAITAQIVSGAKGDKGDTGSTGPTGATGPQGVQGSTGATGATGSQGIQGIQGAAATIAVGTVTTGAAGSSVAITNAGTSSAAVFNFAIPRGDTGAAGAGTGDMLAANNLSDLASIPTAKTNLGINNIDNTSDVNKPVSTAQAAADALKAPIASPTFTGTTTSAAEAITNTNGTLNITAVTDGGDFNINHSATGTKTLALYGTGANIMNVNLLDGVLQTNSVTRLDSAGNLSNTTFDTATTGNILKVAGTAISAKTGTGSVVLATSPTLTTPVISSIVNTGTITLPTTTDTLVGRATADTITGVKTFGAAGNVGKLAVAGTTSGTTVLNATAVASGTLTLPAATDTLVGKATTDTLSNKTFSTQIASTVATGTAPLSVSSTTNVANLNADTVDGIHASSTPTANTILPLNSSSKIPVSVIDATPLTQTNAGTAGGTINYINEGGIKRAWGISSAYSLAGNSFVNGTVTLPTSFFTTLTGMSVSIGNLTSDGRQFASIPSATTTTLTLGTNGVTGAVTTIGGVWFWEVTGT